VIALPIMISGQQSSVAVQDDSIAIKKGDTIYGILKTYRVSLIDFQKANPNIKFSNRRDKNGNKIPVIRPGDIVHIPAVSRPRIVAVQSVTDSVVKQQGREIVLLRRQINRLIQNNRVLSTENAEFLNSIGSIQADMEKLRTEQEAINSEIYGLKVSRDAMRNRLESLNSQLQQEISDHTSTKFLLMGVCMIIILFVAVILIWYFSGYIARVGAAQYAKKVANESSVVVSNTTDKHRTFEDGKRDAEKLARLYYQTSRGLSDDVLEPDYFAQTYVYRGSYTGSMCVRPNADCNTLVPYSGDIMVLYFEPSSAHDGTHIYQNFETAIPIAISPNDFSVLGVLDIATWEGHFRSSDGTNPVGGSTPSFDANIFESNITTANRIN
jgi:hypothetical protein